MNIKLNLNERMLLNDIKSARKYKTFPQEIKLSQETEEIINGILENINDEITYEEAIEFLVRIGQKEFYEKVFERKEPTAYI